MANDREMIQSALNYIKHVGANHVMRGQPHPQQWIVDGLEAILARPEALQRYSYSHKGMLPEPDGEWVRWRDMNDCEASK